MNDAKDQGGDGSNQSAIAGQSPVSRREVGLDIMRRVIGEQYFAKRQSNTNAFNADLRCLSEEYCFGEIWARPGLERKFRSMLCIAMLVALNRGHELRLHVSGAINNGCTVEEIKEVLLQATVYCGLPSGVEGVRIAEEALRELGIELGEANKPMLSALDEVADQ
jgi:4-carboxymuconolactone decarboxylase